MKSKIVMIAIVCVLVVGGGFLALRALFPPVQESTGPVYSTAEVKKGNIEVGVEASGSIFPSYGGSIEVPGHNYNGSGSATGPSSYNIAEMYVKVGDELKAGDPICRLAAPSLTSQLDTTKEQLESARKSLATLLNVPVSEVDGINPDNGITITATIDGRLSDLTAKVGEKLTQGAIIGKVVNDGDLQLTAKLTSYEIAEMKEGDLAVLRLNGFNDLVSAKVTDINWNAVTEKSKDLLLSDDMGSYDENAYEFVYWVTVEVKNPGLIRPGMQCDIAFYHPDDYATFEAATENLKSKLRWCRYSSIIDRYVSQQDVLSQVEGVVTKVHVKNGAMIKKGNPIVSMAGADVRTVIEKRLDEIRKYRTELVNLQAQAGSLTLVSPSDGVLSEFSKKLGQSVSPGDWLGSVFQATDMRMWVTVDDTDVVLVKVGAPVTVTLDALPDQKFEGMVESVSTMGKNESGVAQFEVNMTVVGSKDIKQGMQAKAHIGAGSAEDVLLVPLEAIFKEDNMNKVEVLEADGTTVRLAAIEIGLMNNRYAEVISGLEEGEMVITGSTSDMLSSQTTENKGLALN